MCDYKCDLDVVGMKRATTELGEIETDREAAVEALRQWVLAQSDWLMCPTDTQFLLAFLRHRKFSQKAAKDRLVKFWVSRSTRADWFVNVDTNDKLIQEHFRRGIFQLLPKRDKDGCAVIIERLGLLHLSDMKSIDFVKNVIRTNAAWLEHFLTFDMNQVCGVKVINDFTDVSIQQLFKLEMIFSEYSQIYLNSYPIRFQAFCMYNVGAVVDILFPIIKRVLPKKLRDRVTIHKTLKTVYEIIDMSVLPVQYLPDNYTGPNGGDINEIAENFAAKMKETKIREFVLHMSREQHTCDVKKKPHDVIPTESFRSLQI